MNTTLSAERPDVLDVPTTHAVPRVSQRAVVVAEWIKLRSVRSTVIGLAAAGIALVLLGMLFSSLGDADRGPGGTANDSLAITFGGVTLSQVVIGVLAALFVAGEYSTGMIRTMFGAVGRRSSVLRAKAVVFGGATWLTMTVAAFVTFFAGQSMFGGDMVTYDLGDPGVVRVILGVGVYSAAVAVIGVALGFLLRSTAAAIGVLVTMLMIVPVLARLLPGAAGEWISKLTPSGAGDAIMSISSPDTLLSPGAGLATLVAWTAGLLALAAVQLRRRDA